MSPTAERLHDWNVVVTLQPEGYRDARALLRQYGEIARTSYFNVLVMRVPDTLTFTKEFAALVERVPGTLNFISHVSPAERTFDFTDRGSFEAAACATVREWVPRLAGRSFHVRMHRRGLRSLLPSQAEERWISEALLEALAAAGAEGHIAFDDPDAIIAIETVDFRAGISLWTRDCLLAYPFLGLD